MSDNPQQPTQIGQFYKPTQQPTTQPPILNLAQDVSILKRLLNPSILLDKIEHELRGEVKRGQQWIQQRTPLCNQLLIDEIMHILNTYVSPETFTSDLTEWDINAIMRDVCRTLATLLLMKGDEGEVSFENYNVLFHTVEHLTLLTLKRAENGRTLKFLSTTQHYSYAEMQQTKPDKKFSFNPLSWGK